MGIPPRRGGGGPQPGTLFFENVVDGAFESTEYFLFMRLQTPEKVSDSRGT